MDRLRFVKNANRKAGDFSVSKQSIAIPEDRDAQEEAVRLAF